MSGKEPKFEGFAARLGDKEFIIPPLAWRQLRSLTPVLLRLFTGAYQETFDEQMLNDYLTVIHAAIARNYSDFTKEDLEEVLDLGNVGKIFLQILGASGFSQGGEPGKDSMLSIGGISIPMSSPAPGGPGK